MVVSRQLPRDPLVLSLDGSTNVVRLQGLPSADFVAIDPFGRWAATGTWKGSGINVYAADTGQLVRNLQVKGSACVMFSSDGNWLAAAGHAGMAFWTTGSWEPWERFVAVDQVVETTPMAFSPDGSLLAAASANCEVRIYKFPDCERVATLKTQTGSGAAVSSICFSPSGNKLAAIEWNGQVDLWDLRVTRNELQRLNLDWKLPPLISPGETQPTPPTGLLLDAGPFSKEELAEKIPPRDSRAAVNALDLSDYFNAPLAEACYSPAG
jgi:WD40 repeat protein